MQRLLITACVFLAACGSALGSGVRTNTVDNETPKKSGAKTDEGRVALQWQERMLKELANGPYVTAYGLFSEGGWSNAGQTMILRGKEANATSEPITKMLIVGNNRQDIGAERILTVAEAKALTEQAAIARTLDDVDFEAYDSLNYEYVEAAKDDSGVHVVKRVYVRNPLPDQHPMPKHEALIKTIESIRNAKAPRKSK